MPQQYKIIILPHTRMEVLKSRGFVLFLKSATKSYFKLSAQTVVYCYIYFQGTNLYTTKLSPVEYAAKLSVCYYSTSIF